MEEELPRTPPNRRSRKMTIEILRDMSSARYSRCIDTATHRKSSVIDAISRIGNSKIKKSSSILNVIKDSANIQEDTNSIKFSLCSDIIDKDYQIDVDQYPFLHEINMNLQFYDTNLVHESNNYCIYNAKSRFNNVIYSIKSGKSLETRELSHSSKLLNHEVRILGEIGEHPNIVRYFSSWIQGTIFYVQFEYVPAGSIANFLRLNGNRYNFSNKNTLSLVAQIAGALKYLENLYISHNCINISNILISYMSPKFDQNKKFVHEECLSEFNPNINFKLYNFTKSLKHIPDKYGVISSDIVNFKNDIFDFAVVICKCLGFDISDRQIISLKSGKRIRWSSEVSNWWKMVLHGMLHRDVNRRSSLSDILNNSFIREYVLPESQYFLDY